MNKELGIPDGELNQINLYYISKSWINEVKKDTEWEIYINEVKKTVTDIYNKQNVNLNKLNRYLLDISIYLNTENNIDWLSMQNKKNITSDDVFQIISISFEMIIKSIALNKWFPYQLYYIVKDLYWNFNEGKIDKIKYEYNRLIPELTEVIWNIDRALRLKQKN